MLSRLRSFWRDRRGNALVIAGAGLPLLIGAAGLGVDTFALSVFKRQLQRAADSGALAGAYSKLQSEDLDTAVGNDNLINEVNDRLSDTPLVESAPTVGTYAGDAQAVRVSLTAEGTAPFINFFLRRPIVLKAEAVAKADYSGEYCVVSLYGGTDTGIELSGNTNLDLGCGMKTNARGGIALNVTGSAEISASPLSAVGGIPDSARISDDTVVQPYSPPQPDPFADLPTPPDCATSWGDLSDNPHDTTAFNTSLDGTADGAICLGGMDIKGTLTLAAGTYYITGDLHFNSGATITGSGVTLVLVGEGSDVGQLDINGGANVDLTAPDTGPYPGVAIYRDRRADPGDEVHWNGGANMKIQGAVYLPTTDLRINGNFGAESTCIQFVAYKVDVNGGGSISNSCPPGASQPIRGLVIRLVS